MNIANQSAAAKNTALVVIDTVAEASPLCVARIKLVDGEGKLDTLRGAYAAALFQALKTHEGKISGPNLKGELRKVYKGEREAFIALCESKGITDGAQRWDKVVRSAEGIRTGERDRQTGKVIDDKRKDNGKGEKAPARDLGVRVSAELSKLWKAYMADETSELGNELIAAMELVADAIETLKVKLDPPRA